MLPHVAPRRNIHRNPKWWKVLLVQIPFQKDEWIKEFFSRQFLNPKSNQQRVVQFVNAVHSKADYGLRFPWSWQRSALLGSGISDLQLGLSYYQGLCKSVLLEQSEYSHYLSCVRCDQSRRVTINIILYRSIRGCGLSVSCVNRIASPNFYRFSWIVTRIHSVLGTYRG